MKPAPEKKRLEPFFDKGPQSALEQKFIKEYLQGKGHTIDSLRELPIDERKTLMKKACRYASLKLAEIESRAHVRDSIRNPSI